MYDEGRLDSFSKNNIKDINLTIGPTTVRDSPCTRIGVNRKRRKWLLPIVNIWFLVVSNLKLNGRPALLRA